MAESVTSPKQGSTSSVLSPTGKTKKLFSPSSSRHLRSPSSPGLERSPSIIRPGSPLERTSSIPRLNSSSKVSTLARQYELKIEMAQHPSSPTTSAASTPTSARTPTTSSYDASDDPSSPDKNEESIRALVRIRPFMKCTREEEDSSTESKMRRCIEVDEVLPNVLNYKHPSEKRQYSVDGLLTDTATQEDVFKAVGMSVVDNAIEGYNGSIFAYGQTGSGKTHTMQGEMADGHVDRGVIPRILEYLFERLTQSQTKFDLTCSYLELYNEKVYDLLDSSAVEPKYVREDTTLGIFVQDLMEQRVTSPKEALHLLDVGGKNRTVGSTDMNRESSRSHSVFTIKLTQKLDEAGVEITRKSTLHLVDLAGSEKQSHTGAVGTRLKEATQINKSLSVLGNVITALVDVSNGIKRHVPYRDSKLTFLLRDALGGNSKTTLIATVSAEEKWTNETYSTLQFMQRAKNIKIVANKNEDTRSVIKRLQIEIIDLRGELEAAKSAVDVQSTIRSIVQEEMERMRMNQEDKTSRYATHMTELAALKTENETLEERIRVLEQQDQSRIEELTHAHDEFDECQKLLQQMRLDFERTRQAHTSESCLVVTLREELTRKDAEVIAQQEMWAQKLQNLQIDLDNATQQLKQQSNNQPENHPTTKQSSDLPSMQEITKKPILENTQQNQPSIAKMASIGRRTQHRHSESDLSEEFRQAIGAFSIPGSIEEAHRDLQLQHDQLLHVMQKLDGLRNSKKFLQHALQTTLNDNAEMVQSLRKLQVERNTALEAMHKTIADQKQARQDIGITNVKTIGGATTPALKRAATTFSGFSTIQAGDEMKQLAADKVTLTSRLKASQSRVQILEEELKRMRSGSPSTIDMNAWAHEFTRVTRAMLTLAIEENLDLVQNMPWSTLQNTSVDMDHTVYYEGLVDILGMKLKQLHATVDNQKLSIQILEKERHCLTIASEMKI